MTPSGIDPRDLLVCSAVPQPTAPPRALVSTLSAGKYGYSFKDSYKKTQCCVTLSLISSCEVGIHIKSPYKRMSAICAFLNIRLPVVFLILEIK
jgi:hypothetical protein